MMYGHCQCNIFFCRLKQACFNFSYKTMEMLCILLALWFSIVHSFTHYYTVHKIISNGRGFFYIKLFNYRYTLQNHVRQHYEGKF